MGVDSSTTPFDRFLPLHIVVGELICAEISHLAPRTRGCTDRSVGSNDVRQVTPCPAHAGMYRIPCALVMYWYPLPRARGDVPALLGTHNFERSPCPAHAGMYRLLHASSRRRRALPRARGDVPAQGRRHSPPGSLPRARGDVPLYISQRYLEEYLAPRTRGCTGVGSFHSSLQRPCPAHAGMYRHADNQPLILFALPRVRGDVPSSGFIPPITWPLAPRTRGCTDSQVPRE